MRKAKKDELLFRLRACRILLLFFITLPLTGFHFPLVSYVASVLATVYLHRDARIRLQDAGKFRDKI